MKVLIVSAADQGGGAFIAARRLHFALRKNGLESTMLVAKKTIKDPFIVGPESNVGHSRADLRHYLPLPFHLLHKTDNPNLHSFNVVPSNLHKVINAMDVDVVNLHWVNREMMSVADIGKINKPIVWTLHDMWPLLGTAHYEKFLVNNGKSQPLVMKGYIDLDEWMYARKRKHWVNKNICFVGPSQWMAGNVQKSRLFSDAKVEAIVNPVDTGVYRPHSRSLVREILGLDQHKRYVLFGAMTGASDIRKGFPYLQRALQALSCQGQADIELLVLGGGSGAGSQLAVDNIPFKVNMLGQLHDDLSIKMVYNAADVFVTPSLADNLPNTIVESLSCGTPVVAFAGVGGIGDMVIHQKNGYLAALQDSDSLAEGIVWALEHCRDTAFRDEVRRRAVSQFDECVVASRYLDFYRSVIG